MNHYLLKAMNDPSFYPHEVTQPIQVRETHISWVFLTGPYAYKIKKPVVFGGILDFSTLKKRQYYALEEVRLNQRLEPEMYLGVVSLRPDGVSAVNELDESFEYSVKMIQYPEDRLMYKILQEHHAIPKAPLQRIAKRLSIFHQNSSIVPNAGSMSFLQEKIEENFLTTQQFVSLKSHYVKAVRNFMKTNLSLFDRRIADERIRDNHGDVQPRNIFLLPEKEVIFDCIEFNPLLRQGDVAEEVAFLAMELDFQGLEALSDYFIQEYVKASRDYELLHVLSFYKSYRALVRAKVALFNAQNKPSHQQQLILHEAKKYLELAYTYFS